MSDKPNSHDHLKLQGNRLPCRGCTPNCSDYSRCNGKPWRLPPADKPHRQIALLSIYYDSQCPLCQMEMQQLVKHDQAKQIKLIDLHEPFFAQNYPHINIDHAMNMLHAETESGKMLYGLDVTCHAWKLVGKHKWLAILRWPIIKQISDSLYLFFAKHRNKISYLLTGKRSCNC